MQLRLRTDYALRVLLYLGLREARGAAKADAEAVTADLLARTFSISRDHVVKVVQELARQGWVHTRPGRRGGIRLAADLERLTVSDVVAAFEGRQGLLECVATPDVCVLEPGCRLRRVLIDAEQAFYDVLSRSTLAELCRTRGRKGGLLNLELP